MTSPVSQTHKLTHNLDSRANRGWTMLPISRVFLYLEGLCFKSKWPALALSRLTRRSGPLLSTQKNLIALAFCLGYLAASAGASGPGQPWRQPKLCQGCQDTWVPRFWPKHNASRSARSENEWVLLKFLVIKKSFFYGGSKNLRRQSLRPPGPSVAALGAAAAFNCSIHSLSFSIIWPWL